MSDELMPDEACPSDEEQAVGFFLSVGIPFYGGMVPVVNEDGTLFKTEEEAEQAGKALFDKHKNKIWIVVPMVTVTELEDMLEENASELTDIESDDDFDTDDDFFKEKDFFDVEDD